MRPSNKNKFIQAVKFIYDNIDKSIVLEDVAKNLNISVSSLKRLFLDATDKSVGHFIRRLRMEKAFQTLQSKNDSILEIALNVGFEDHSAFSRRFKENFGYSPTFARQKMNIMNELEYISLQEPEIVEIDDTSLQVVTKQGLYFESAPLAWQSLKEHLTSTELSDDFLGTFIGIGHDNPHDGKIAEDKVRFSAGIAFCEHNLQIEQYVISGGSYAKFNYQGKVNNLGLAYHYIYGKWLSESGMTINHEVPAFTAFKGIPTGMKEEKITIYVPLNLLSNIDEVE